MKPDLVTSPHISPYLPLEARPGADSAPPPLALARAPAHASSRLLMPPSREQVRMYLRHTAMSPSGGALGEGAAGEEVYRLAAHPLVEHALSGGQATLLTYGQTGSGKTYTIEQVFSLASPLLAARARHGARGSAAPLRVSAVEVLGRRCVDLLSGSPCQPLAAAEGGIELKGATLRQATGANATSSRSHMARLERAHSPARPPPPPGATEAGAAALDGGAGFGVCSVAQLHPHKSTVFAVHERQREGAEINTSLHALKNCVRAFAERARSGRAARMPFRDALLTRRAVSRSGEVVAERWWLRGDSCQLAVLGCVSPASAATEHSLSTLRTVMELAGGGEGRSEAAARGSLVRVLVLAPPVVLGVDNCGG
ncbi:hypothetical protein EMIHUDRAFT_452132 [Emiliania huxleyi CCMP1516]|uniref:Kinesin motor domain-containing protein n=2 Tax=Emiliania huxleyi TaxID=2903 RepID=A0A0D3IMV1_EMIH1|nr:hypothetical protein EMIHUDRAFT_452132 [Emiliania huxleyi CCMP1516]EOD12586.1 hypothetical protein EMIHUDRAFT_452132 [Emiliania huxleyi CCMP1516]|eukprot:XP_005765015.1 hypothetical protein EMIHUDRAFT_452132 [Emiliania huxleyi CCMP1516]